MTDNPDAPLVEAMARAIFENTPRQDHREWDYEEPTWDTLPYKDRFRAIATAALAALRRVRPDNKTFPVIGFGRIPWSVAERAYDSYVANFGGRGQSLERVAERGGFYVGEMDQQLPGWREECTAIGKLAKLEAENAGLRARIANLENPQPLALGM